MTMEKDIEKKLVTLVASYGGNCLKWVCPGWSGVPDRIVLLPGATILFVETKRPSGVFSSMQKWWERRLTGLGFDYWRVCSFDDLDDLKRYLTEIMGVQEDQKHEDH